ncbi:MAG: DUF4157 domain-containing protein [Sphingobacteriales bacterium]|nr:MAG: DUF4157 domain-containing protein [Sphingobacteriales bacterium]
MKPIRIIENSWLARIGAKRMRFNRIAMVIGKTIHLYGAPLNVFVNDKRWIIHELRHIQQYEETGFWKFVYKYTMECIRKGYYNNAYEVDARACESDETLLTKYDISRYRQ